ncbi:acid-sensing ion channel 2-like [Watersipora subatra]|uniref:acid-sensing ion channel 2-like n=1 Tax=Watersipora subatra TaxID=2589382 RepID=UPI00355BC201
MILIGVGYFTWAAYLFLRDYSRQIVSTKIKIKNTRELQLPTVTICNKNIWKSSQVIPDSADNKTRQATIDVLMDLYLGAKLPPPPGKYNWSDPAYVGLSKDSNISSEQNEQHMKSMSHSLNETFTFCRVLGVPRLCSEVLEEAKTDAGFCHQFNKNGSFHAHTAGISGGFVVLMNALVHEYFIGPSSFSEGFAVAIHDVNQVPLLMEFSYGVQPGTITQLLLHRKQIKRVPPYADGGQADCFDTDSLPNPLHYYPSYSYSACKSECQVSHVLKICGCRDIFDVAEFLKDPKILHKCNCRATCNEIQYTARLSSTTYPSKSMAEIVGCGSECYEYNRKNFVMLYVVYGEMSYELLEEDVMYKGYDLIANLGGTMGVCIGASFLTLMELIEYGLIQLSLLIQKVNKVNKEVVIPRNVPKMAF